MYIYMFIWSIQYLKHIQDIQDIQDVKHTKQKWFEKKFKPL